MARPPLAQLTGISLTWGGDPVFDGLDLTIQPGDRLALVGRNGSGKSTLMKVMAGLVEPDRGARVLSPGTRVGYMEQEPAMEGFATLGDWASHGLDPGDAWRIEAATEGLAFDPATPVADASGGERRRAALAKLFAEAPDLMLLDEPTNHLDIAAVLWLERELAETKSAFVLISHDRAVLTKVTRATLWLDRGEVRRQDKGFAAFEDWRDTVWAEEDLARHKLDRKIRAESRWAVEGISARRKRNQGRLRALGEMKTARAAEVRREGTAAMALESAPASGKRVIEARGIGMTLGGRTLFRDLSLKIGRGDRVALVGPNGAGKTTLLKCLTGEVDPDEGEVLLGTKLSVAVFDQARAALDPETTLWDSLSGDPAMRVKGAGDQVMVRGQPKHVVGYLKDFLFDEARARAKVGSLSGGERARLLLAKLMAKEANLLVLDEPTNDLDIETLDLLQELLGDFAGTVLIVSHDRDFIDRLATQTLAFEGRGRVVAYAGGWSDMIAQGGSPFAPEEEARAPAKAAPAPPKPAAKPAKAEAGLSFTEAHRLKALPGEIARLEAEICKLEDLLADADLYARAPVKFAKATEALTERQARLAAAEEEWLTLAEKEEAAAS